MASKGAHTGRFARLTTPLGLLLLLAIFVMINMLSSRHYRRADWTRSRVFSLSQKARGVLAGLRQPVQIKLLMSEPGRYKDSVYLELRELLQRFQRHSAEVSVELVDIDSNPTRAALLGKQYQISAADLREGVVIVAAKGRSKLVPVRLLPIYEVGPRGRRLKGFRGEAVLLSALLAATSRKVSRICFTEGHGEADLASYAANGYGILADEVRRDGYQVKALSSAELLAGAKGCRVLILGGPSRAFAPPEVDALDRFFKAQGRVFALLGPVLDRGVTRYGKLGLEPLFARWGVGLPRTIVIDPVGLPGEQPLLTWATRDGYGAHPIGRALAGKLTLWPLTRELRPLPAARAGIVVDRLVVTSDKGWAESDLASLKGDRPLTFDPAVDSRGPVAAALAVRWKNTRLVVFGTERGLLNRRLTLDVIRDYNRDLFLASLGWLAGEPTLVAIGPKQPEHLRLALDERQLARTFLVTVVALPAIGLCIGLLVWWRRRR